VTEKATRAIYGESSPRRQRRTGAINVSLFLRIWWASDPIGRKAAAVCFLAGALTIRYAWLAAGRVSARNPQALFELQSNPQKLNLSL
jgi:hypothetical protein